MMLADDTGHRFDIQILGYQFPEVIGQEWDSNWLNISCRVVNGASEWSFSGACLLTWEVSSLASWLAQVADMIGEKLRLEFIEPELQFESIVDETPFTKIRIHLDYSAKPSGDKMSGEYTGDFFLDIRLKAPDLLEASNVLLSELSLFPKR